MFHLLIAAQNVEPVVADSIIRMIANTFIGIISVLLFFKFYNLNKIPKESDKPPKQ